MKHKTRAMLMALVAMSWAQTATQTTPNPQQNSGQAARAKCPCCDKTAAGEMKCAHHEMQAKDSKDPEAMPSGKDGMSCMRTKQATTASCCGKDCEKDKCSKDKTTASCCGDRCGKNGKNCCGKTGEKAAANCCRHEMRG